MPQNGQSGKTWHDKYEHLLSLGDRTADRTASFIGSWRFIIAQTVIVFIWMSLNVVAIATHWDPYPFILLNLLFSTQAAYAAPIIMMTQNRQSARDRVQAIEDYHTNLQAREAIEHAKNEIEALQERLARIENEKIFEILQILRVMRGQGAK